MNKSSLYYIAAIPPVKESYAIKQIKEGLKTRFNISHSLKSPAHITLQMPFRRKEKYETDIIKTLNNFAVTQQSFKASLKGFGHFSNKVIFIKVKEHSCFIDLHKALVNTLKSSLKFPEKETSAPFHPHITIAHKDLSPETFNAIWNEFQLKQFNASFLITGLSLLKHNSKKWYIYKSFPFKQL